MARKVACFTVLSFIVVCFAASSLFAQSAAVDLKAKLGEVRAKKSQINMEYKNDLAKCNTEAEQQIDVIKKDFHEKRDVIVKERAEKQKELLADYKEKVKPLEIEEKSLIEQIGPNAASNFAKTKAVVK